MWLRAEHAWLSTSESVALSSLLIAGITYQRHNTDSRSNGGVAGSSTDKGQGYTRHELEGEQKMDSSGGYWFSMMAFSDFSTPLGARCQRLYADRAHRVSISCLTCCVSQRPPVTPLDHSAAYDTSCRISVEQANTLHSTKYRKTIAFD